MKRLTVLLAVLLAALPLAWGQNNPYEIDDLCYEHFQMAESLVADTASDAFEYANGALLMRALEVGDEKARTLHYVCKLKRAIRHARNMVDREAGNTLVEDQKKETVGVALETGFNQYFYYSYVLCQTYYANTSQPVHAQALLQEMMDIATRRGDEYGIWQSHSYIAVLYQHQNDRLNARKHLLRTVEIYESTDNPTIRRQTISRQYCDLADTYTFGSDSARLYYRMAEAAAKTRVDTLRYTYYNAQLAALDHDLPHYRLYRDFCLGDPDFLRQITTADMLFASTDALLNGAPRDSIQTHAARVAVRQQMLFIRFLAINLQREDIAAWMGTQLISSFYADINQLNDLKMEELSTAIQHRQLSLALEEQRRLNLYLWIAIGLLGAALAGALVALARKKKPHTS